MASGLKIAYLPKIELVTVEDTSDTVAIKTIPKFELVVIVADAVAPAVTAVPKRMMTGFGL
jgi:hypothetical protein